MARLRIPTRRAPSLALLGRLLSLAAFLPVSSRAPMYARLIWVLVRDPRMPGRRKAILAGAAGYFLMGRDIVPDRMPVIGGLDDLVVVVLAVELFLDGVPSELLAEKLDELGIDRAAYDRDIDTIRRLIPRPVRRALRELARLIDGAVGSIAPTTSGRNARPSIT
jgi:uncharacterized membrane protein YkvA (DUF1232 family)